MWTNREQWNQNQWNQDQWSRGRRWGSPGRWVGRDQPFRLEMGSQEIGAEKLERGLALLGGGALLFYGVRRPSLMGFAAAIAGGALVAMGLRGSPTFLGEAAGGRFMGEQGWSDYPPMPSRPQHHHQPLTVQHIITVDRPVGEVYSYWRNLHNLPHFMKHVESVQSEGDLSHWVVNLSPGMVFEWDARISSEQPNELIAWQTLPGAPVDHTGTVRFRPTPDGKSTIVEVSLAYYPPAGFVGETIAKLEKAITDQQIKEDMRRFKQVLETGEVATNKGQPQGV